MATASFSEISSMKSFTASRHFSIVVFLAGLLISTTIIHAQGMLFSLVHPSQVAGMPSPPSAVLASTPFTSFPSIRRNPTDSDAFSSSAM